MTQLALLVTLKNDKGDVTGILTVKAGERIHFSRYHDAKVPHLRVVPVNGTAPNDCVSFEFSGSAVISDANGNPFQTVDASTVMMGNA